MALDCQPQSSTRAVRTSCKDPHAMPPQPLALARDGQRAMRPTEKMQWSLCCQQASKCPRMAAHADELDEEEPEAPARKSLQFGHVFS